MRDKPAGYKRRSDEERLMAQKENPSPDSSLTPLPGKNRIYTVPPHQSFVNSLAAGILAKADNDPAKLSDITVLVPSREAEKQLRQAFLEQMDGRPGIVPKIEVPGDVESENLGLSLFSDKALSQKLMNLPPAVTQLKRQLILAEEILKIPGMASSVQKAVQLGGELGRLIDELQRHNIELKDAGALAPPEFKKQWAHTAEFLKIVTDTWPQRLKEMKLMDPVARKNALISVQLSHWLDRPPAHPVIAAGFSETSPAVMDVLKTVALLPSGAVVLPGLDRDIDQQSWDVLTPVHPQFSFKNILEALQIDKNAVSDWSAETREPKHVRAHNPAVTNAERQKLLRETVRPSGTSEGWGHLKPDASKGPFDIQALSGVDLIVCPSPQDEASVIALKLRETLEVPGRSATLVTADRSLARRVSARLKHWKIDVEDSAGKSLTETSAGIYLLSTARMAAEEWAPVPLLEALKHPLAGLGENKSAFRARVTQLEDMILHGPRPAPGAKGAKNALTFAFNRAARRPAAGQTPEERQKNRQELTTWLQDLEQAGKPFFDKMASITPVPFIELLDAHIRFAETLAADDKNPGIKRLWKGADGVKAAQFLTQLRAAAKSLPAVTGRDYADVLGGLMLEVNVKPKNSSHPLLKIVTPEQARLTKADVVIIGGLNDGAWPKTPTENPWLSPAMAKTLGLPPQEEKIGRETLQFIEAASNPNILLSRSVRSGSAPTVESPLLTRFMMVLKSAGLDGALSAKSRLLDINKALHAPASITPIDIPAPKPPPDKRPKQLPVSAIETLMSDPYAVYAKYILNIKKRRSLDASLGVNERGTLIHEALARFIKKYPDAMPKNAYDELIAIGAHVFKTKLNNPSVQSFWWPKFERIAQWFIKFEGERRKTAKALGIEVGGKLEIDIGGEIFTLTAVADRIDRSADDQLVIVDYKTGAIPPQSAVESGVSPQLTLEALIAFTGGFDNIDGGDVGKLQYWKLSGGRPAGAIAEVRGDVPQLVAEAKDGVTKLLTAFNDKDTPYLPTPRAGKAPHYAGYDHLSRVDEWSKVRKTTARKAAKKTASRGKSSSGKKRGRT